MAMARSWWALALALSGCGRSGLYFPPPDPRLCIEDLESSAGCSFVASPSLHLVDPLSRQEGIEPSNREPDGVFVVNPDDTEVLTIQTYEIPEGSTEELPFGDPMALLPGERVLIRLPTTAQRSTTERRGGDLLRLEADAPFTASFHGPHRPFLGNDSALMLPDSALGRHHVVVAYPPHIHQFQGAGEPTFFEIVAQHDDTRVSWRPLLAATAEGPGVPRVEPGQWSPEIILHRHEALLVIATTDPSASARERDVSGTVIESSAPIRVVGGSRCSTVPVTTDPGGGCDPLYEQLIPVEAWGQTYVVPHPPLRTREAHHLRIYAGEPGVTIRTEPSVLPSEPYLLATEGEFLDVLVPHGTSFTLSADGPVMAVGYLQTRDFDVELGDPAMYQLASVEQYLSRYEIATGTQWDRHFAQLVRPRGSAEIVLDGESVGGWERVGAWETAILSIAEGAHVARSTEAFGLTQFGWTNSLHDACARFATHGTCQTSYAHPGGMGTAPLR